MTAVAAMTSEQFADFAEQMRLLVAEESYLWEFPAGSRDLIGQSKWQTHGPWRWEDCREAISLWFGAGLVQLSRTWPHEQLLTTELAYEIMRNPDSWAASEDGSTNIALAATERGEDLAWEAWIAMLRSHHRR